ncbi:MAG: aldo/keto reductase, partial [Myxococcales bacterium]|nr:aldo/keto reductase [Myxococcales bacterium]
MRQRALGKTGLVVSELSVGTWGLSGEPYGPVDESDAEAVLKAALDMGITLFDTSDSYGGGKMEALLGRVCKGRDDVVIVTKGGTDRRLEPPIKRFDETYLRGSVERSLKRLGLDAIPVFLLHCPSRDAITDSIDRKSALETLRTLKDEGKIRF